MEGGTKRPNDSSENAAGDGLLRKRIKTEIVDEVFNGSGDNTAAGASENAGDGESNGTDNGKSTTVARTHLMTEAQRSLFRDSLQAWLHRCPKLDGETVLAVLQDLLALWSQHDMTCEDWRKEVLTLWDVQKTIKIAVQVISRNKGHHKELMPIVRQILCPCDTEMEPKYFPEMKEVTSSIYVASMASKPFVLKHMKSLPIILHGALNSIPMDREINDQSVAEIQEKLEATMKDRSEREKDVSHYLLCVCVLQLFGYDSNKETFLHNLSNIDLENITKLLEEHFKNIANLKHRSHKQAYILSLAVCDTRNPQDSVQFVVEQFGEELCPELQEVCQDMHETTYDLSVLEERTSPLLKGRHAKLKFKSLLFSIKSQFHCLQEHERCTPERLPPDDMTNHLNPSVRKLMDLLGMTKYYPQKLKYEELIKLTPEAQSVVCKKPTSLPELPWYFMKHVIGLDSDTRDNCHVTPAQADDWDSDSDDDDDRGDVHPIDLVYVIFLCADDFLRQELADKMVKCQYAVPFILPSAEDPAGKDHALVWGLQSITRTFVQERKFVTKPLVDVNTPLVVCMDAGRDMSWKSKLLNKMLSPQQETFWHQELTGGNSTQVVSNGMVQVAWHLPGNNTDKKFHCPVTFLNVRNSGLQSEMSSALYDQSTVSCIFTDEVNDEVRSFLSRHDNLKKLVLVVLHKSEDTRRVKEETRKLQEAFGLQKSQVIRRPAEPVNFNIVLQQLTASIKQTSTEFTEGNTSLKKFVEKAKADGIVHSDDNHGYHGKMAAQSVLKSIDEINSEDPGNAKAKVLPCQSDLVTRKEIASLGKEFCRQKKLQENTTVQDYAYRVKDKIWKLQLKQVYNPVSPTFLYFVTSLLRLSSEDRRYFLQYLKLGLNERSEELLQPKNEEYERCRQKEDSEEKEKRLKELDEKLMHGSLGLEHFFREMAVVYENLLVLKEKVGNDVSVVDSVLDLLSGSAADALVEGSALEIMDGDAVSVPEKWLKAVFSQIEQCQDLSVFKVSVLGAQSCGKSTLLNTVFGLNFPVSSGRCTRGAYMQLVKVDDSLKETLKCDYVAVIDSEGLMSRSKTTDSDYDNELSTFIIGLSDLTLVIIKGEGNEMNDVLPLAIHVFMRMNIVGEHQSCRFVHQNMGAVDAISKVATEIDAFVRELNEKTLAAATDVGQSDRYTKFTDVLCYNPVKDNTYVPGLWNGALPMAKTSSQYAATMQNLKSDIVNTLYNLQVDNQKRLGSFTDMTSRMAELWTAIKYENFVLSFRNVLAVEAHRKLSKLFDEEQWALKREIQGLLQQEEHIVENEVMGGQSKEPLDKLLEDSRMKMNKLIAMKTADIEKKILHYFNCMGCADCSDEVKNRHLLANSKIEFTGDIKNLLRRLLTDCDRSMDSFKYRLKTDVRIHQLGTDMDDKIKRKVEEFILKKKADGKLSQNTIETMFNLLWSKVTEEIRKSATDVCETVDIEGIVEDVVISELGTTSHVYVQERHSDMSKTNRENTNHSVEATFTVDPERHIQANFFQIRWIRCIDDQDINRLGEATHAIIEKTKKHYDSSVYREGRQFQRDHAEVLFREILYETSRIRDERFKVTDHYVVDLVYYIQMRAVEGMTKMHQAYCAARSPSAILEQKRRSYRDLFAIKMGQGDAASEFCDNVVKDLILTNIEEQISCAELLHDLRVHCGEMFRDIKSVQARIMIELFKENEFQGYIEYITQYDRCVKIALGAESVRHFKTNDRFTKLGRIRLDQIINKLVDAMDRTVKSSCSNKQFVKTFLTNIENLKISHNKSAAFVDIDVQDRAQFRDIVCEKLQGPLRDDIMENIQSWDVEEQLQRRELVSFLFDELVGCKEVCPFCDAPCDIHSGGKGQSKHATTLHRPMGLGKYRDLSTGILIHSDCCINAASSDQIFSNRHTNGQFVKFKDYSTIYPDWKIDGNADPDVEKYWKWVLAQHNAAFAHHYSAKKADIPAEWYKYDKLDIAKDIEEHYRVKVDVSMLE